MRGRNQIPDDSNDAASVLARKTRRNIRSASEIRTNDAPVAPREVPSPGDDGIPSEAMPPQELLRFYSDKLTPYERGEVLEYPNVYFFGRKSTKASSAQTTAHNFGFDDERGDYRIRMHDHLQYRYQITEVLGQGSFGQVVRARDHKTGEWVAIKVIRNKKRFHSQALVEVKILECLRKWDPSDEYNLIKLTDHFYFRNHLCIVSECLSLNLYEFIKQNNFRGFSLGLIRRFTTQLLQSLTLLCKHNVVHCDLKPENILLKHPAKSAIKMIDFGSSCLESERVYTYIQSRFYRSPEVILGMAYGIPIDMWSLGCIVAELYTGYPIFPGEDEHEQLALMMEVLGLPPIYLTETCSRRSVFFDSKGQPRPPQDPKAKKRRPASKTLRHVLRCQDERFLDFVARCLCWDPSKRMRPDEGLRHEWITEGVADNRASMVCIYFL
ncbi:kinase-like domain-containing protein [Syncephalis fuscata]|nr:kinase-like domain-containing protein [Syncephalis fuscata]